MAPGLLPSETGELRAEEADGLWALFVAIAAAWGDPDADPILQKSQWLEFIRVRTLEPPSYLEEYRNALRVLKSLRDRDGDRAMTRLLFDSGLSPAEAASTPLAHLKRYVVDEFIRVWLATGGFRAYGSVNYNGYVSGSRFSVRLPYRGLAPPAETTASPPSHDEPGAGPGNGNGNGDPSIAPRG